MTVQSDDSADLARRSRQIEVACQQVDVALMARPGALAPGEQRSVLDMLNATVSGCPALLYADPARQITAAQGLLRLWQSMLTDQADILWADPDDEDA